MQIDTNTLEAPSPDITKAEIVLPRGLIGLRDLKHFQLIADESSYPFVVMRSIGDAPVEFVTVEPAGVIPDYVLEISEMDAAELEIAIGVDSPLILNIVIIHSKEPQNVTANLIAPVIINRKTGIGKQVVLENYAKYATDYQLVNEGATADE